MKTKIIVIGDIIAVDYCSTSLYDEDNDFNSCYYLCCGWDKVEEMRINDNEENIVKKKGKYLKTKDYFHNLFKADGDHPLPVEVHTRIYYGQEIEYEIEHDGDFDINFKDITDDGEKQQIVRKYVDKIDIEKTDMKRHYRIIINMKNGSIYKFKYYCCGP